MRIMRQGFSIFPFDEEEMLQKIEWAGRTCYQSEDKMGEGTAEPFVRGLIKRGHESVLEHASITVKFITDRATANEIVRHRHSAYSQESTRYCRYGSERFGEGITVIEPAGTDAPDGIIYAGGGDVSAYGYWFRAMKEAENAYMKMIANGCKAETARSALPLSLKTDLVMTANIREWRSFFRIRTGKEVHPQLRALALALLKELTDRVPVLFEDILENTKIVG